MPAKPLPKILAKSKLAQFYEENPDHIIVLGEPSAAKQQDVADKNEGVAAPDKSGAALLDEVSAFLSRFVVYPSDHAKAAHVLWIAHTHMMQQWDTTPRLAFLSPEPASGKTRALEMTELLVPSPVEAISVSAAYLFRKVGNAGEALPTILFDEIDTVFGPKAKENEDIRGLLNAGHRKGAVAGRCVVRGKVVETEEIPAYCAVALAGLGWLPDTILTRSVVIRMRKRKPNEKVEPFRRRLHVNAGHALCDRLALWARTVTVDEWPDMPSGIEDRDADVWEDLLAIAVAACGEWPEKARKAAVALVASARESEPSLNVRLLTDIKTVFEASGDAQFLATEALLHGLRTLPEAPWGDLRGKPLDAFGLARRLRQYEIRSKVSRVGEATPHGYAREAFLDAWGRYVLLPSGKPATPATLAPDDENASLFNGEAVAAEAEGTKAVPATPATNTAEKSASVSNVADVAALQGDREGVCAHCQGGPSTTGTDAPTVRVADGGTEVWVHPECEKFWREDYGRRARRAAGSK
jgi:hypothetical protein